jgi:hypothetical protein
MCESELAKLMIDLNTGIADQIRLVRPVRHPDGDTERTLLLGRGRYARGDGYAFCSRKTADGEQYVGETDVVSAARWFLAPEEPPTPFMELPPVT